MFNNILKKFNKNTEQNVTINGIGNGQITNGKGSIVSTSGDVHRMEQSLQKKFARGIQYNMKIVIRGDRNVGKTCLFYRLQGDKFHEDYKTTDEIQVTSIQWNYNATDDVVKVEIWDVVDKGKRREPLGPVPGTVSKDKLKLVQAQQQVIQKRNDSFRNTDSDNSNFEPALDAEFVDVYKGAHGAIFVFDMTKIWTFEYVQRELAKVPHNLPVMILANHRDMGHHRVVTPEQVQGFIETLLREERENGRHRSGEIRYTEASMRNGFGLRYLYKFFNLPFLHLQKVTLQRQLERNEREMKSTAQELDALQESDENNYDLFLEMLTNRRRQVADSVSGLNKPLSSGEKISLSAQAPLPRSVSQPSVIGGNHSSSGGTSETPVAIVKPTPSIIIGANNPLPAKFQQQMATPPKPNSRKIVKSITIDTAINDSLTSNSFGSEFEPEDENMFRKFLDEPTVPADLPEVDEVDESDDDDGDFRYKPMVAKYQEDLDPEDLENESNTHVENYPDIIRKVDLSTLPIQNEKPLNNEKLYFKNTYENFDIQTSVDKIDGKQIKSLNKKKDKSSEIEEQTIIKVRKNKNSKTKKKKSTIKSEEDERQELEDFLGGPLSDNFATPNSGDYESL